MGQLDGHCFKKWPQLWETHYIFSEKWLDALPPIESNGQTNDIVLPLPEAKISKKKKSDNKKENKKEAIASAIGKINR